MKVIVDRGLHDRGVFARTLGERGIPITPIALESPEMIGTVERHGDLWKQIAKRVVVSKNLKATSLMKLLGIEVNNTKNEYSRHGGYAPRPHRPAKAAGWLRRTQRRREPTAPVATQRAPPTGRASAARPERRAGRMQAARADP